MTRPYEMPFYPVPPVLGIVLNLVLTGVLVQFLIRTDPLALLLSGAWIGLGGVAYVLLNRYGPSRDTAPGGVGEAGDLGEAGETGEASIVAGEDSSRAGRSGADPVADEDD
jgi:hypothetical protein